MEICVAEQALAERLHNAHRLSLPIRTALIETQVLVWPA